MSRTYCGGYLPLGCLKCKTLPSSLNMLTSSKPVMGWTLSFLRAAWSFLSSRAAPFGFAATLRLGVPLPPVVCGRREGGEERRGESYFGRDPVTVSHVYSAAWKMARRDGETPTLWLQRRPLLHRTTLQACLMPMLRWLGLRSPSDFFFMDAAISASVRVAGIGRLAV